MLQSILRRTSRFGRTAAPQRGYSTGYRRHNQSNNPFHGFTKYLDTSYVPMLFFIGFMFSATINVTMAKHDYEELQRRSQTQINGLKALIKRVEAGEKVDLEKERELWTSSSTSKDVEDIFQQIRDSTVETGLPASSASEQQVAVEQPKDAVKPLTKFI